MIILCTRLRCRCIISMYSICLRCRCIILVNTISVLHYAHASAVGVLVQCIPHASAVGVLFKSYYICLSSCTRLRCRCIISTYTICLRCRCNQYYICPSLYTRLRCRCIISMYSICLRCRCIILINTISVHYAHASAVGVLFQYFHVPPL